MGRVDVRDIDDATMEKLDAQCKKYGLKNRTEYVRLLINLDVLTNIVGRINNEKANKGE